MFVYIIADSHDISKVYFARDKSKLLNTLVKNLLSHLSIVNMDLYNQYCNYKFSSVDEDIVQKLIGECQIYNSSGQKFFHVIKEVDISSINIPYFEVPREERAAPAAYAPAFGDEPRIRARPAARPARIMADAPAPPPVAPVAHPAVAAQHAVVDPAEFFANLNVDAEIDEENH